MWLSMQFAWLLFAYNNSKMGPCITFSVIKEKFYDSSALIYTRLVTHLHWSTFVYIRLCLV